MSGYWLGVATPFGVLLAAVALREVATSVSRWLYRRGWRLEIHLGSVGRYSNVTLRRDIVWERAWLMFFAGGWYFEDAHGSGRHLHRWAGVGRVDDGPIAMVIRVRGLPAKARA